MPAKRPPLAEPSESKRIDLNLLSVFDMVMTERHVSRASERLGMTQSAVSNALNRLRQRFQDRLFVKAAKGVVPTPKAIQLWPRIHEALDHINQTVQPKDFDPFNDAMQFRIATVDITVALLAPYIHTFTFPKSPKTNLFFVPYDPTLTESSLMRGELDFCIGIQPPRSSVIETIRLWSDSFRVVARVGHPLMNDEISLASFCATPHLAVNEPGNWDAPSVVDLALEDQGLVRNVAMSVNQFVVVPDILLSSDLIAVLPSRMAHSPRLRGLIVVRPMPVEIADVTVYLSWHHRNSNSAPHTWMKQRILEATSALTLQSQKIGA